MAFPTSSRLLTAAAFSAALLLPSCGGGGGSGSGSGTSGTSGNFALLSSNLGDGVTWELNRLMEFEFNNPIDPDSVSFSTVRFTSPDVNQPVTGSFEIKADGTGRTLVFRPHCPSSQSNDNGSFVPGGHEYRLTVASSAKFGAAVLRDKKGRPLTQGFTRTFYSPEAAGSDLFVDYVEGPLALDDDNPIEWPAGLNLFSDPDGFIRINFNQAIDARPSNLNQKNLYVLYADGEVGSANENVFPETNRLPGRLSVADNCGLDGSTVNFEVAGILPTNRKLKVVIKREFSDIAGQENAADLATPIYTVPTLAEYFDDNTVAWGTIEVADEYSDDFSSSADLDLSSGLPLPAAEYSDGFVQASFDFPGEFTTQDFLLNTGYSEIFTNSQTFFTDSNNTTFTVQNGVLNVRNFTIESGSELRGRGENPLIIYATGEVRIDGRLNVSGNNAVWPTGLNSPQRPEGGAKGECGGGDGGTSSQEVFQETYRGSSGNGGFNFSGQGGQGGESGFNQSAGTSSSYNQESINNIAGGGGGGTFAITPSVSPHWYRWTADDKMPEIDRNYLADHVLFWDTATDPNLAGTRYPYVAYGGEDGTRGSSWNCSEPNPDNNPVGIYGMEDEKVDIVLWYADGTPCDGQRGANGGPSQRLEDPWDDALNEPNPLSNDPLMTTAIDPYNPDGRINGHPTDGPDGGKAGPTIFSNDGSTSNDFWGTRINADGSVTVGELLVPWAGSGGGASGDMVLYNRNGTEPLPTVFPEPNFPNGRITKYRKGAPGGGGGGQVQVLAIGDITIGGAGEIWARGGNGVGGESIGWTYGQISGSGGGSGGHIVLSTASKLDISAIDLLDGSAKGDTNVTVENGVGYEIPISDAFFSEAISAVGGRRGWAMSRVQQCEWLGKPLDEDGNGTYAIGRGGAGSNGIVQIHVPNPATDIVWPASRDAEIRNYIHNGNLNNDADIDNVEEMLRIFAAPQPVVLVPLFSAESMFRSRWVDTGLADLRQPATGTGVDFPDYASSLISIAGFDTADGTVNVTNEIVDALPAVVTGATSSLSLFDFEAGIGNATAAFAGQEHFLRSPSLLLGYVFRPNVSSATAVEVVSASYDRDRDVLTLLTEPRDGAMAGAGGVTWSLSPRFFRFATNGASDVLPDSTAVRIEFQGAEESGPGTNVPGVPFPGPNSWTSNLADLEGYRFIRYQVVFDIDAQGTGVDLTSPRPLMRYVKIPFTW
ncbi:MAG: hypothetical protein CMJ94_15490 [Planctomycetes bacterium]|nr:hypothetical protein [Planctomycetota bacterium]